MMGTTLHSESEDQHRRLLGESPEQWTPLSYGADDDPHGLSECLPVSASGARFPTRGGHLLCLPRGTGFQSHLG